MKRIILFLNGLLVALTFGAQITTMKAEIKENLYPIGSNYIDFSQVKNTGTDFLETKYEIAVKKGMLYTFALSTEFIGSQHYNYIDLLETEVIGSNPNTHSSFNYLEFSYLDSKVVYFSFQPSSSKIHIKQIPFNQNFNNLDIILYEGAKEEFMGFERYIGYRNEEQSLGVILARSDQKLDLAKYLKKLKTVDINGVETENTIEIKKDDYSPKYSLVGDHNVLIKYKYNDVTVYYDLVIRVIDYSAPIIEGPEQINMHIDDLLSLNQIESNFNYYDNSDPINMLSSVIDVYELDLNMKAPGIYNGQIAVKDSKGNQNNKEFKVFLYDDETELYNGLLILNVSKEDPIYTKETLETILKNKGAGEVVLDQSLYNEYKNANHEYGVYNLEGTTNSFGGTRKIYLKIVVSDNRYPSILGNNAVLSFTDANQMTLDQIRDWIAEMLSESNKNFKNLEISFSEYQIDSGFGDYYVYFEYELDQELYSGKIKISYREETKEINYGLIISLSLLGTISTFLLVYLVVRHKKKQAKVFDTSASQ